MALPGLKRLFTRREPSPSSFDISRIERAILVVSPSSGEQTTARVISMVEGWRVRSAQTLDVALTVQARERITVILYDQDLPEISWQKGVRMLLSSSQPVFLILLSLFVHERLRRDVLACGGCDVAVKPLDRKTLVPLVNGCCVLKNDIDRIQYT